MSKFLRLCLIGVCLFTVPMLAACGGGGTQAKSTSARTGDATRSLNQIVNTAPTQRSTPTTTQAVYTPQASTARKGERTALLIGNSRYKHITELVNPGNDVRLMDQVLSRIGFKTEVHQDLSRSNNQAVFRNYINRSASNDVSVIYFAGHAVQIQGENYLIPVDFDISGKSPDDTVGDMVSVSDILRIMERAGARKTIIVLDACRNDPFEGDPAAQAAGIGTPGLAIPPAVKSNDAEILFLYATAPGQVAYDGEGGNSPFTSALAKWLPDQRLSFNEVVQATIREVTSETDGDQVPWVSSNFSNPVQLAKPVEAPVPQAAQFAARYAGSGDIVLQPDIANMIDGNVRDSAKEAAFKNVDDIRYVAVAGQGNRANVLVCQGVESRCDHGGISAQTIARCEQRSGQPCAMYAVIRSGKLAQVWQGEVSRARGSRNSGDVVEIALDWQGVGGVTGSIDYAADGFGELKLEMRGGTVRCAGVYTIDASAQGGAFNGTCTDGVKFSGTFTRNSQQSFSAEGTDSQGRRFDGEFRSG
ncbi:MAG: caspase family protein [Pseudomonadota bacterium]